MNKIQVKLAWVGNHLYAGHALIGCINTDSYMEPIAESDLDDWSFIAESIDQAKAALESHVREIWPRLELI